MAVAFWILVWLAGALATHRWIHVKTTQHVHTGRYSSYDGCDAEGPFCNRDYGMRWMYLTPIILCWPFMIPLIGAWLAWMRTVTLPTRDQRAAIKHEQAAIRAAEERRQLDEALKLLTPEDRAFIMKGLNR